MSRVTVYSAFSLIELVITVVIIGVIAAIAVPRVSGSTTNAKANALMASLSSVRTAIDLYTIDHDGRTPDKKSGGVADASAPNFVKRLSGCTDLQGAVTSSGEFGPYLRSFPVNPFNDKANVRLDGAEAGNGAAGWHYDTATTRFAADDSPEHANY